MPGVSRTCGPDLVGQVHRFLMDLFKGSPGDVSSGFGHGTAMHRVRVGPEPAASRLTEQRPDFAVHALAFPAGRQREQNDNEGGQRELASTRKGLGGKRGAW